MTEDEAYSALEAILMVSETTVKAEAAGAALNVSAEQVERMCRELQAEYDGTHPGHNGRERGFAVAKIAGGWQLQSRSKHYDAVVHFLTGGHTTKLSPAALETLAIIAYRQPVSRATVAAIRGVNVDGVIRTLKLRGLIVPVTGHEDEQAHYFVTTDDFLALLGLNSLSELPDIAPHLPDTDDLPTWD